MSIKEFTEEIAKEIEARIEGVNVTPMETWKNNGVFLNGITLCKYDNNVSPILYMNRWYERFEKGEISVQDAAEQVLREYEGLSAPDFPDVEEWLLSENLIDNINIRLVSRDVNRQMITARSLVYYDLEDTDLVCLFYGRIISDECSTGDIAITENILQRYLPEIINGEELFHEVLKRVQADMIRFETMENLINRLMNEESDEVMHIPMNNIEMYVLTNKNMMFGASAVLAEVSRQQILDRIPNGKVTVLPASVHETILIPTLEDEDIEKFKTMVKEVNRLEVSNEDFLSDNVYHYDANTGKLKIAYYEESEV